MKLFKYEDFRIVISEEAWCIKAFSAIWKRDRNRDKGTALLELGLIYFMFDPRSSYMYIRDEDTRFSEIKKQEGLPDNYTFDVKMEEAIEVYKKLTKTTTSELLESARICMGNMSDFLREVDFNEMDDKGRPKFAVDTISRALEKIPKLTKDFVEAEKALNAEIIENAKVRGQKEKTVFDDGLDFNS